MATLFRISLLGKAAAATVNVFCCIGACYNSAIVFRGTARHVLFYVLSLIPVVYLFLGLLLLDSLE